MLFLLYFTDFYTAVKGGSISNREGSDNIRFYNDTNREVHQE